MRAMTSATSVATPDMRWVALDLVCALRKVLGLRDHDIATLRGLLSVLGPQGWDGPMMVHASNKLLQERCDGADERSLRRRLTKLIEAGLIHRRQSPNRKRYVLRDSAGDALVYYGFDLSPLRDALPQLQAMAKDHMAELEARRVARALLRHRLYEITILGEATEAGIETLDEARLALRRQIDSMALQALLDQLGAPVLTQEMSDSDSQIDRHIENTKQDSSLELIEDVETPAPEVRLSLGYCLSRLKSASMLFPAKPCDWTKLHENALEIGQSMGLTAQLIFESRRQLGTHGTSLAILGLVEAQGRIRNAQAYLTRILADAKRADFDIPRMFRTLTRNQARFPAGNVMVPVLT